MWLQNAKNVDAHWKGMPAKEIVIKKSFAHNCRPTDHVGYNVGHNIAWLTGQIRTLVLQDPEVSIKSLIVGIRRFFGLVIDYFPVYRSER
jgi:hypothetical protein